MLHTLNTKLPSRVVHCLASKYRLHKFLLVVTSLSGAPHHSLHCTLQDQLLDQSKFCK